MGEDQWVDRDATTLPQFLGSVFVWIGVGFSFFMLFMAGANLWVLDRPVARWLFYVRVVFLVGALVVTWVLVARALSRSWSSVGSAVRVGLVVFLVVGGVASAAAFRSTARELPPDPIFLEGGGRFAFGAYPTPDLLDHLARAGFDGVVSILEPRGPAEEASLFEEEQGVVAGAGLRLMSVPLFDQGSLDRGSLATLRDLVREDGGRYYVHGLTEGSTRLEQVRRLVLRLGGRRGLLANRLEGTTAFERGPVFRLEPDVHLTPFPTDAEILEFVAASPVRTVVALLDPESPEDLRWIEHERGILEGLDVAFHSIALDAEPFDPAAAVAAAELLRTLRRPIVVHAFLTPSIVSTAVRQAYATGLPPLPPAVFEDTLSGGPVRVVAGHVATGPRPVGREFGWLHRRGVRAVAAAGGLSGPQQSTDRGLSDVAGLEWYFVGGDVNRLLERLASGGPWYVYGGDAEDVGARITERFGAPLTESHVGGEGSTEQQQE